MTVFRTPIGSVPSLSTSMQASAEQTRTETPIRSPRSHIQCVVARHQNFSTKTLHWMKQGESIMCEMNKFDDMMALLAKKNPNFYRSRCRGCRLEPLPHSCCGHAQVDGSLAKISQRYAQGLGQGHRNCHLGVWYTSRSLRLFVLDCHRWTSLSSWMCSLHWSHHVWMETPGESFSWKMYSDARLAASDWHFQFTQLENFAEWCLANSFGQIRAGWISDSALAKLVRLSWTRVLFQSDTKTLKHLPDHLNPYFGFHNAVIKECGERYKMTAQIAAASDGRILERMGAPEVCACGINSPDREHLTFHCNADTAEKPVLKTHNETRLLQPLVLLPNTPIISALTANVDLVQCLRQLYAVDHSPVVLALDGSCLVNPGNDYTNGHPGDCHLHEAFIQWTFDWVCSHPGCCRAWSFGAGHAGRTFCSCACAFAHRQWGNCQAPPPRIAFLATGAAMLPVFWSYIAMLVTHGVEVMWVPSHDKKPLWTPVLDWNLPAQKCRKLNELADLTAAQITDAKRDDFVFCKNILTDAHQWATSVFLRQWTTTRPFHYSVIALQKAKHRFPVPSWSLTSDCLSFTAPLCFHHFC